MIWIVKASLQSGIGCDPQGSLSRFIFVYACHLILTLDTFPHSKNVMVPSMHRKKNSDGRKMSIRSYIFLLEYKNYCAQNLALWVLFLLNEMWLFAYVSWYDKPVYSKGEVILANIRGWQTVLHYLLEKSHLSQIKRECIVIFSFCFATLDS